MNLDRKISLGLRHLTPPAWRTDYPGHEGHCAFVSSRGLWRSCPVRTDVYLGHEPTFPLRFLRGHRPGGRIYVHNGLLRSFARRYLWRLRVPFTLVSGDTDYPVGPETLPVGTIRRIAAHPKLIAWHAQNLAVIDVPRLFAMPIGMDYHTLSTEEGHEWGPRHTPVEQEALLDRVRLASPPPQDRAPVAYANWHLNISHPERAQLLPLIPEGVARFQPARIPREQVWTDSAACAFTLTPRGYGMDCHRHWEAVALGSIPVLQDLPINALFDRLPALVVRDWATLSPDLLARAFADLAGRHFDFAPMLLRYWLARIDGATDLPALEMTLAEFLRRPVRALEAEFIAHLPAVPHMPR